MRKLWVSLLAVLMACALVLGAWAEEAVDTVDETEAEEYEWEETPEEIEEFTIGDEPLEDGEVLEGEEASVAMESAEFLCLIEEGEVLEDIADCDDVREMATVEPAAMASINGVSFPYPDNYSSSYGTIKNRYIQSDDMGSGCWRFAYLIYGDVFHRHMSADRDNSSCVVTPYHQVVSTTAQNLKEYILKSGKGAIIRVTSKSYYDASSDGSGHSMAIIDADNNGAWLYQAQGDGLILSDNQVKYWTWDVMAQKCVNGGFTSQGQYIKYILCPQGSRNFGGADTTRIQLWAIDDTDYSGTVKLWAKRFDSDSTHYAIFYIDDQPITGHISSDDNGYFSVTVDTTQYSNGNHKFSIYYANTSGGDRDQALISFKNMISFVNVPENSVWSGNAAFEAKRFDNDSNHYAIFYLNDVRITGHVSADSNGYFRKTLDTTGYANGTHQLSIYYANTNGGGWDVKHIVIQNDKHVHTTVSDAAVAATCTKTGKTAGSHCSTCGTVITPQQTIPAKGHTKQTVKGKAATCTATGLTDGVKCSVCNTWITPQKTIAAKGHTKQTVKGYAATYTSAGLTDGVKCSVCNTWITNQTTIARKTYPGSVLSKKGKNGTITAYIGTPFYLTPQFATNAGVTVKSYKSSKKGVATVDKTSGLVVPKKEGKATITVTTKNKKQKATVTIKVVDPYKPTGISITGSKTVTLKVGQSLKLGATLQPTNARTTLTWKSSKKKVASVNKTTGEVKALKKGKTKITVTTKNKKKATITIKVVQ